MTNQGRRMNIKPYDLVPGMKVKYSPTEFKSFLGEVGSVPWQLSEGTWVVKLIKMESAYGLFTGKKGDKARTVFAAAVNRVRPAFRIHMEGEQWA